MTSLWRKHLILSLSMSAIDAEGALGLVLQGESVPDTTKQDKLWLCLPMIWPLICVFCMLVRP